MTLNKIQKSILEMLAEKPMTAKDVGDQLLITGHRPTDATGAARNCSIMANQGLLTKKKAIDERVHEPRTFYSTSPEGLSVIGRFPQKEAGNKTQPKQGPNNVMIESTLSADDLSVSELAACTTQTVFVAKSDGYTIAESSKLSEIKAIAETALKESGKEVEIYRQAKTKIGTYKPVISAEFTPAA